MSNNLDETVVGKSQKPLDLKKLLGPKAANLIKGVEAQAQSAASANAKLQCLKCSAIATRHYCVGCDDGENETTRECNNCSAVAEYCEDHAHQGETVSGDAEYETPDGWTVSGYDIDYLLNVARRLSAIRHTNTMTDTAKRNELFALGVRVRKQLGERNLADGEAFTEYNV